MPIKFKSFILYVVGIISYFAALAGVLLAFGLPFLLMDSGFSRNLGMGIFITYGVAIILLPVAGTMLVKAASRLKNTGGTGVLLLSEKLSLAFIIICAFLLYIAVSW